jgi:hypothetical protein
MARFREALLWFVICCLKLVWAVKSVKHGPITGGGEDSQLQVSEIKLAKQVIAMSKFGAVTFDFSAIYP